ncbi:hypothetical protein AYI70_g675 [Smittium culicis]|uniref:Uncharacterized protein n=1 Tax=Smittium culicis TaxID=133412 RepID=A0A1R1YG19_9FUNG|nr:hypothetical protein AYI70_g675 [Smittium culicis]
MTQIISSTYSNRRAYATWSTPSQPRIVPPIQTTPIDNKVINTAKINSRIRSISFAVLFTATTVTALTYSISKISIESLSFRSKILLKLKTSAQKLIDSVPYSNKTKVGLAQQVDRIVYYRNMISQWPLNCEFFGIGPNNPMLRPFYPRHLKDPKSTTNKLKNHWNCSINHFYTWLNKNI